MSDVKISMWGAPRTGKTTYLAALYDALENQYKINWQPRIYMPDGSASDTEDFQRIVRRLGEGILPESTDATPRHYVMRAYKERMFNRGNLELSMIDVSGELAGEDFGQSRRQLETYIEELRTSDGIFLLIDPDVQEQDFSYYSLFDWLFSYITTNDQPHTDKLLAYCITKIDLHRHWQHRKDPESYLRQCLPERAYNKLKQSSHSRRTAYFAVSSIGRYPHNIDAGYPNLRQVLTLNPNGQRYDLRYHLAKPAYWAPYNVVEPFKWMTNKLGVPLV